MSARLVNAMKYLFVIALISGSAFLMFALYFLSMPSPFGVRYSPPLWEWLMWEFVLAVTFPLTILALVLIFKKERK